MEYVDGATLAEMLRTRGPLPLSDAREIASQFLAGLEAIHAAGLVHRDFKPENIMLTRAGRVVVMDFGIARAARDGPSAARSRARRPTWRPSRPAAGTSRRARRRVLGRRGARRDGRRGGAATRWRHARRSGGPCAGPRPRSRRLPGPSSCAGGRRRAASIGSRRAFALARALEEVTLRAAGPTSRGPTLGWRRSREQDAEYFFGREVEVEGDVEEAAPPPPARRDRPLGCRQELVPARRAAADAAAGLAGGVVATPGNRPFLALAQALVPQLRRATRGAAGAGRASTSRRRRSARCRAGAAGTSTRWSSSTSSRSCSRRTPPACRSVRGTARPPRPRRRRPRAAVVRDDFLFTASASRRCSPSSRPHAARPAGASALRRALVQPALKCGYQLRRRGPGRGDGRRRSRASAARCRSSPLPRRSCGMRATASAACSRGRPTRRSGGVAGALAQHAEATLERIGPERVPLVRELFRNLVTAQGTRAARDREELLSVFPTLRGRRRCPGRRVGARRARRRAPARLLRDAPASARRARAGASRSSTSRC